MSGYFSANHKHLKKNLMMKLNSFEDRMHSGIEQLKMKEETVI